MAERINPEIETPLLNVAASQGIRVQLGGRLGRVTRFDTRLARDVAEAAAPIVQEQRRKRRQRGEAAGAEFFAAQQAVADDPSAATQARLRRAQREVQESTLFNEDFQRGLQAAKGTRAVEEHGAEVNRLLSNIPVVDERGAPLSDADIDDEFDAAFEEALSENRWLEDLQGDPNVGPQILAAIEGQRAAGRAKLMEQHLAATRKFAQDSFAGRVGGLVSGWDSTFSDEGVEGLHADLDVLLAEARRARVPDAEGVLLSVLEGRAAELAGDEGSEAAAAQFIDAALAFKVNGQELSQRFDVNARLLALQDAVEQSERQEGERELRDMERFMRRTQLAAIGFVADNRDRLQGGEDLEAEFVQALGEAGIVAPDDFSGGLALDNYRTYSQKALEAGSVDVEAQNAFRAIRHSPDTTVEDLAAFSDAELGPVLADAKYQAIAELEDRKRATDAGRGIVQQAFSPASVLTPDALEGLDGESRAVLTADALAIDQEYRAQFNEFVTGLLDGGVSRNEWLTRTEAWAAQHGPEARTRVEGLLQQSRESRASAEDRVDELLRDGDYEGGLDYVKSLRRGGASEDLVRRQEARVNTALAAEAELVADFQGQAESGKRMLFMGAIASQVQTARPEDPRLTTYISRFDALLSEMSTREALRAFIDPDVPGGIRSDLLLTRMEALSDQAGGEAFQAAWEPLKRAQDHVRRAPMVAAALEDSDEPYLDWLGTVEGLPAQARTDIQRMFEQYSSASFMSFRSDNRKSQRKEKLGEMYDSLRSQLTDEQMFDVYAPAFLTPQSIVDGYIEVVADPGRRVVMGMGGLDTAQVGVRRERIPIPESLDAVATPLGGGETLRRWWNAASDADKATFAERMPGLFQVNDIEVLQEFQDIIPQARLRSSF